MPMTTADCERVNSAIIRESGRIGPEIHSRIVRGGPWIALTPRAAWPDGMGLTQSNMTFERMLPANDAEVWADVAPSDGASVDQCLPPVEVLKWGQTLRTWNLQRIAKQTEEFCIEDLRSAFDLQKMLQNFTNGLQTVTKWVWENRDRNEYIRIAAHKVTETSNPYFNLDATSFDPAHPPTSRLTNGTLEQIYQFLIHEGAGPDALGFTADGNAPIFGLMTDMNTSRDLIRQDPELRADFRFAFEGSGNANPLTAPMGVARSYNGFKHLFDPFPARYEIVGGVYVRVQPFKDAASTNSGTKRDLNPAYIYATYQDTVVHVPSVYTQRVPNPITNPGGKFKFDPVNYMGDFQWLNIRDKLCNPRGTKGFFDAVFASASEPVHPEYGYVIRHLNCPPLRNLRPSCYS